MGRRRTIWWRMTTLIGVVHDFVLEQLLSSPYGDVVLCGEGCHDLVTESCLCPNQGANVGTCWSQQYGFNLSLNVRQRDRKKQKERRDRETDRQTRQKIVTTYGSISILLVLFHPGLLSRQRAKYIQNFSLFTHFCKQRDKCSLAKQLSS